MAELFCSLMAVWGELDIMGCLPLTTTELLQANFHTNFSHVQKVNQYPHLLAACPFLIHRYVAHRNHDRRMGQNNTVDLHEDYR